MKLGPMGRLAAAVSIALVSCAAFAQELPPPDTRTKPKPRPKTEEKKPPAPAASGPAAAAPAAAAPVLLLTSDLPCSLTLNGEPHPLPVAETSRPRLRSP